MTLKVDGESLPDAAVEAEYERLLKLYTERLPPEEIVRHRAEIRRQAKDHAIGRQLLLMEALRLDLSAEAVEIENEVDGLRRKCGDENRFQAHLQKFNLTPETLRESIRNAQLIEKLIEQVTAEVADPTEAELLDYFETHQSALVRPESVRVSQILVRADSADRDRQAAARAKLMRIKQQFETGEDFAVLAAAHSGCPTGKRTGGDLGLVGRGVLPAALEAAAFALEVNTVSDPVETPLGLHLILKKEHCPSVPLSLAEVRDDLRLSLHNAAKNKALTAFIARLQSGASIEDDAAIGS